MDKTDLFLDNYKKLENLAIREFHLESDGKAVYYLESKVFPKYRNEIAYCREVRNLLQHNPRVNGDFLVEPGDGMIKLLELLIGRIEQIPKCMDIAIPLAQVFSVGMEDSVFQTMVSMKEHVYTHVPILENGRVIGVFSDNSIFSYPLEEEIISLDKNMTFQSIRKYLPLDAHPTEKFRFIKQDSYVYEIEDVFEEAFHKNERIGMLFVTAHGKAEEKILGIITPWDVLAVEE